MTAGDDRGTTTQVPTEWELLQDASHRLVRTVDGLQEDALTGPSLLPGWSRAHVVAHLALNAEALERALTGLARGDSVPMYASQESRDADIAELARAGTADLRARLMKSITCFAEAATGLPESRWEEIVRRTGAGPEFPARMATGKRWREVEIHHADLDAGYTHEDWPPEFAATALAALAGQQRGWPVAFRVLARDLAETWQVGEGDPARTISGNAADLAWWLAGRGHGEGLTSDQGALPEVPPL